MSTASSSIHDRIEQTVLEDGDTRITVLNVGCAIQDWRLSHLGVERPMVLGLADPESYRSNPEYFGAIVGRVANRTGFGRFELDGETVQLATNQPPHHLHGGRIGLGRRIWGMNKDSAGRAVQFAYHSPDGEDGYPGAVDFKVSLHLDGATLRYEMEARPDRPTPVSLAQHNYYNLDGQGDCRTHRLQIDAETWTPTDPSLLPTGEIAPLTGTRYDFRQTRTLVEGDPEAQGSDINLILREGRQTEDPAATVMAASGIRLRLWSDQPALQFYDGAYLGPTPGGLGGVVYPRFGGLCLEPQFPPDTLNKPQFGSIICTPEKPYRQRLAVEIASHSAP